MAKSARYNGKGKRVSAIISPEQFSKLTLLVNKEWDFHGVLGYAVQTAVSDLIKKYESVWETNRKLAAAGGGDAFIQNTPTKTEQETGSF